MGSVMGRSVSSRPMRDPFASTRNMAEPAAPPVHVRGQQGPVAFHDPIGDSQGLAAALEAEVAKQIVGQNELVRQVVIALLAGGHCLVEGTPGLGKTLLVRT